MFPSRYALNLHWLPAQQSYSFEYNPCLMVFTAGASTYTRSWQDSEQIPLPAPIRMLGSEMMIPVHQISTGTSYGLWTSTWDAERRSLTINADW